MFEGRRALLGNDLIRSYFVAQAQRPSALSDVDLAALTPYHRALLVNDGAVTRLLETAVLEPLKVDVLDQRPRCRIFGDHPTSQHALYKAAA
jgi:hypothetical protein